MERLPAKVGKDTVVAKSRFINALDKIAGLLEFDGQGKGGRDIHAPQRNARLIKTAGSNLISPKVEAALVRLAIQEIQVVRAHKDRRYIYEVWSIRKIVVRDRYGRH